MISHRFNISIAVLILVHGLAIGGPGHDHSVGEAHAGAPVAAPAGEAAEKCKHIIEAARCPFCTPELIMQMGWCAGHSRPEAFCTLCNAYLIPAYESMNDWCAGHSLPESQCVACNGEPVKELFAKWQAMFSGGPGAAAEDTQADLPRSRRAPSLWCSNQDMIVKLENADTVRAAGFAFAPVAHRRVTETVTATARLDYNRNAFARITPRAAGPVAEVHADLGMTVERGDLLCMIDSAELGETKTAFLRAHALEALARRDYEREQNLFKTGATPEKSALEMEAAWVVAKHALSGARQRLRNLGLGEEAIAETLAREDTSSFLPIVAPLAGVVVERQAVRGEVAGMEHSLFAIADLSTMWAEIDLFESDAPAVTMNQSVIFTPDGRRAARAAGTVEWFSPQLDSRTRTLRVRASLPNPDGALRAGMFGEVEIKVHEGDAALVVPKDAVQWEGCCNVVFVREGETSFRPRKVALGYEGDQFFVVEAGVNEGDMIVTQGSFLLKTEILKGSIGAGCCEADKPR